MLTFFKRLTAPPVFQGDEEKTRAAELVNTMLFTQIGIFVLALVALPFSGTLPPIGQFIAGFVFLGFLFALLIPLRRGYVTVTGIIVLVLLTLMTAFAVASSGTIRQPIIAMFLLASVFAGLAMGRRAAIVSIIVNILIVAGIAYGEINRLLPPPESSTNSQHVVLFAIAGILAIVLLNLALQRQQEALEQVRAGEEKLSSLNAALEIRVKERTSDLLIANQQAEKRARQLQVVAEVARTATSAQELNRLLNPLTHLISQRFGYYHVGIFLLDEQNKYAVLEASNTEGGLRMMARSHRLKVGEQGIVGFVTSRGEPRIALDVGHDAVFFDNPDLPDTRSELALPLKIGDTILGALDLQSAEENAFDQDDISVLAILADQVAIAIQNASSAEQAQRALREAEIASSQLVGQAWKGYVEKIQSRGYRYDGIKPERLNEAGKSSDEKNALVVPVQLRGQTIGRLKLKPSDVKRSWTEDERAIIESTAERVAIAMEGARLLDEAQKRAARESFLSEMGTKLGTSFQLDSILRDTVEELGQTLKGSTVSFQLVNPSAPPTAESPKADSASARRKKSE